MRYKSLVDFSKMKSLVKGAILGAVAGVAVPVALSVANETLWAAKSTGSITNTRICFAQRHWYIFKPYVKHAKGCRNPLLDSIPFFLLVGVLGGSLISALVLISKGNKDVDTATASPEPPVVLPPTPKAPDVVLSAPQPPVPTPPVAEVPNQPPIQSIPSGVKQSGGRLTNYEWGTIGRFGALVVVVGGIVFGTAYVIQKIGSNQAGSNPESSDNGGFSTPESPEISSQRERAPSDALNATFPNLCTNRRSRPDALTCMAENGFEELGGAYIKFEGKDANGVEYQYAEFIHSTIFGLYADCRNKTTHGRTHSGAIYTGRPFTEKSISALVCKKYFY